MSEPQRLITIKAALQEKRQPLYEKIIRWTWRLLIGAGWRGPRTDDATFESTTYAAGELGNTSWGVIPPLPSELPFDPLAPAEPIPDAPSWRVPGQPIDRDPANADAPGRPAMD